MQVVALTVRCRGGLDCAVAQAQLGCACRECEAGDGAVSMHATNTDMPGRVCVCGCWRVVLHM